MSIPLSAEPRKRPLAAGAGHPWAKLRSPLDPAIVGFALGFWVNMVLPLLGYVPGLVHAIWIIARYDRDRG